MVCVRCSDAGACLAGQCRACVICAEYGDGSQTRGEVEVDAGQSRGHDVKRVWLEPEVSIHSVVADAIPQFDAVIIGPGSFFTSLVPPLLVKGVKEALAQMPGPIILIANLLTEGSGTAGSSASDEARWISRLIDRPVDVVVANTGRPSEETVARYAAEHKHPLELGGLDPETELVTGSFLAQRDCSARSPEAGVRGVGGTQPAPAR